MPDGTLGPPEGGALLATFVSLLYIHLGKRRGRKLSPFEALIAFVVLLGSAIVLAVGVLRSLLEP